MAYDQVPGNCSQASWEEIGMRPLISVIIPIYNVEKYLPRAIESVCRQTYSNLEIILVEDGSPDKCGEICDEYASHDARIKVIHKENGGLSDARNAGLDAMGGEYVAFVDSDDYIAPFFVEELYRALSDTNADISFCQYAVVKKEDTSEGERRFRRPRQVEFPKPREMFAYDRKHLLLNMYDQNHKDATYFIVSWNKLYKAGLWEGIRFPKGKIHEDEATTYKIFDRAKSGAYVTVPMYGYFSAPSSITRDTFSRKRLDWMEALTERIRYFDEKGEKELTACAVRARADGAIKYFYPLKAHVKNPDEAAGQLKGYVREALERNRSYHNLTGRNRLGYRLFLISPKLYRTLLGK